MIEKLSTQPHMKRQMENNSMALRLKTHSADQALTRTKHLGVTEEIRQQIISGDLKPGDRLPSYNARREDYGVHKNTMSKVYAALELEGLIVRRRGSGTFVAERLERKPKASGVIGLSGAGFGVSGYSLYWSHLLGGIHEAAKRAKMQLLILDPHSNVGWEKADGVLLCDWDDPRTPRKELPGLPMVSLLTQIPGIASVVADDYTGMQMAVEHLLSQGHRKIGYLHAHNSGQIVGNRMAAFRDTLKSAGLRRSDGWTHLLHGKYDYHARISGKACEEMTLCLREGWRTLGCTALLCYNDEAALGAIKAFRQEGLRVPEDISVMGFDGTELCDLVSPTLSSIEVPLREIGATGVEMLLQQIEADEVSTEHQVLPLQLRERESTAALTGNSENFI